jgi:MFS family permease
VALANLRAVVEVRDFRRLYLTRLLGQGADGLLQSALATFVLFSPERQPTAASVAGAFAVLFLPYSLVGPFAGVFLDRWRRRQVLVYANLLRALIVIAVAVLVAERHEGLSLAVTVLVVLGVGRFVLAGLSASLPHVVAGPVLVTANALTPTSGTIAAAVGGLAGVGIRSIAGGGDTGSIVVIGCSILTYAAAAAMAATLGPNRLGPDASTVRDTVWGVLKGFADGFHQLRAHPIAGRAVIVVMMHRIAFGGLTVIGLLLTRNTLGAQGNPDAALTQFALITGAAALGALVGAVITPTMARRIGYVRWSVVVLGQAALLVTVALFLTQASLSLVPLLVGAASLGLTGQAVKVCSDTLVQREIPDEYLGRVFALFDVAVNASLVLGVTLVAYTSPESGLAPVVYAATGILVALTAAAYWRSRITA